MWVLQLLWGVLPAGRVKNRLARSVGYAVDPTARVAPVLLIRVERLVMDRDAAIGFGNVLRGLREVRFGASATAGQWNWISGAPSLWAAAPAPAGTIALGEHSAVTSRHYVDATGGIVIGNHSTIAGVRSTILTHEIDIRRNVQTLKGVRVGSFVLMGSNTKIVPGADVPDRVLIAMGSVLARGADEEMALYAGSPARVVRRFSSDDLPAYFRRPVGFVHGDAHASGRGV